MSNMIQAQTVRAKPIAVDTENGRCFAQLGKSSNNNEQVVLNFEILEGEDAGRTIAWFGSFTEKAWQRTTESLRYCGFQGNDISEIASQSLTNEVQLVIEHDEYNGKTSAKVRWVNRIGGGLKIDKPLAGGELKSFAARMKSMIASVPSEATPAPQAKAAWPKQPVGRQPGDDDVDDKGNRLPF